MIEKTFIDRVPTYPGRVTLIPVSGQANVYDMARSDSPIEPGTPLNKATFDSMMQSRLTGRYYTPAVSRASAGTTTATTNPIPTSGWTSKSTTYGKSGNYIATASNSEDSSKGPAEAFTGTYPAAGGWRGEGNTTPWLAIDLGEALIVTKVKTYYTATYDNVTCTIQGSNDNKSWTTLSTKTGKQTGPTDWSFSNSTAYRYYRLLFGNGVDVRVYGWEFTSYTVTTYKNSFTVSDGWPTAWTAGQVALVQIPASVSTVGVVENSINGIKVTTILQPDKRYELRYTASGFVAKEV